MKSIKVKETKTVTVFRDSSWVMDKDFNYVEEIWGDSQISTIEEGLKIPNTRPFRIDGHYDGGAYYLDTKVRINNNTYYVFSGHLKEIEIGVEKKELFIPELIKPYHDAARCLLSYSNISCPTNYKCPEVMSCDDCIFHKDNFKYLQE